MMFLAESKYDPRTSVSFWFMDIFKRREMQILFSRFLLHHNHEKQQETGLRLNLIVSERNISDFSILGP